MEEEKKQETFAEALGETPVAETPATEQEQNNEIDLSAEKTLNGIAVFVLIVGIIAALVCLFTIVFVQNPEYKYHKELMFNASGFATTVEVIIGTLTGWALLKVVANISTSLKEINKKIK